MAPSRFLNRGQARGQELTNFRCYIRLLRIEPSNIYTDPDGPVMCSIGEYSITDLPRYFAISYACGNHAELVEVSVEAKLVKTYANLERALRRLQQRRAQQSPILVWADALCIRQDDLVEKTAQVSLMAKIYGQADEVVIWLGEASEHVIDVIPGQYDLRKWKEMVPSPEFEKQMLELLQRPWWSRLWCYQELCLAANGFFLCGGIELSIPVFLDLVTDFIAGMSKRDPKWKASFGKGRGWFSGREAVHTIEAAVKLCNGLNTGPKRDVHLIDLLVSFRAAQCSDPRDRIFASLSLASDETLVRQNVPSYGLSTRKVYARLAASSIETSRRLHVLNYCNYRRGLPTWVPDWQHVRHPKWPIAKELGTFHHGLFNACGLTSADYSIDETAAGKPQSVSLRAHGLTLDVIGEASDRGSYVNQVYSRQDSPLPQWLQIVSNALGEDIKENRDLLFTFWDTIFASGLYNAEQCQASPDRKMSEHRELLLRYVEALACHWPHEQIFRELVRLYSGYRRFFMTRGGLMGVTWGVPLSPGDIVCILRGGPTPYLIRKATSEGTGVCYEFLRECYVSGYMYGEAMEEYERGTRDGEEFAFI